MDTGNITLDNARPATWSADRRRYEEKISAIVIEQLRMADKIFTAD